MMKPDESMLALTEVAGRLNGLGIQWAVFAGAAVAAYGVDRPITDIDILVPVAEGARVAEAFPEAQLKRRKDGRVWVIGLAGYDILAGLNQWDLDCEMGKRLRYGEIEGVRVPLIPVEDNIVLKAQLGRGAAEGKRDWEDVEELLRVVRVIDWQYLTWRLEQSEPEEQSTNLHARLEGLRAQLGL